MEQHFGLIVSLLSLIISGILAYSYLQIRLSLAEQILKVLNGRYLKRDLADEKLKNLDIVHEGGLKELTHRFDRFEKDAGKLLSKIEREIISVKEKGCDRRRQSGKPNCPLDDEPEEEVSA